MTPRRQVVVFYDGVCGLCNGLNTFLLRRDRDGRILFAPLQGALAGRVLSRHGYAAADLNTVYVVSDWNTDDERVVCRSDAVLQALRQLDGIWNVVGKAGRIVPKPVADFLYRVVARNRHRILGQINACPVHPPEWRARFLE